MNFKSITTLGLVAVALAVTSLAPAEAKSNNNAALNAMAMQMYAQNQAAAANANIYNPAFAGNANIYNNPAIAPTYGAGVSYNGQTPWSAGARPYGNTGIVNASYGATPWAAGALPYGAVNNNTCGNGFYNGNYGNSAYGNIVSPQYTRLANEVQKLQNKLLNRNLSWNERNRINARLNQISLQQRNLAASGYGSPYNYGNSGLLGNVRGILGL